MQIPRQEEAISAGFKAGFDTQLGTDLRSEKITSGRAPRMKPSAMQDATSATRIVGTN